ncbi:hypothetical protein J6590_018078 [Homalodisca vitripennis]|nr:hypothetical protein J6590_018078 [Homalodisca vitripennis]
MVFPVRQVTPFPLPQLLPVPSSLRPGAFVPRRPTLAKFYRALYLSKPRVCHGLKISPLLPPFQHHDDNNRSE